MSLVSSYYGGLPTAMDANLATIVDGGRANFVIFREAVQIFFFSCNFFYFTKPFNGKNRLPGDGDSFTAMLAY